jgi:hypothetical protein
MRNNARTRNPHSSTAGTGDHPDCFEFTMAATKASTPKAKTTSTSGVRKGAPKGGYPRKNQKMKNQMAAMQAFCKLIPSFPMFCIKKDAS